MTDGPAITRAQEAPRSASDADRSAVARVPLVPNVEGRGTLVELDSQTGDAITAVSSAPRARLAVKMLVRARRSVDVERLCDLVRIVHATDSYPVVLQPDVRRFIVTENCLAAWVCELQGQLVGHVALHSIWSDEVAQLASSSMRRPRETLASVSRLFVDPTCRRLGIGAQLLAVVKREAHDRGLWPVLDVVTTYTPAISLYERSGWTRLGTIALPMPDGRPIDEYVFAALEPRNRL